MNYKPNLQVWRKGDIVIHDADAKEPRMLMRVVGRTRGGLIKTQYCNRRWKRNVWKNEPKYLHDPKQFELDPEWGSYSQEALDNTQRNWDRVRRWNFHYKPGLRVWVTGADGGFWAVTSSQAYMLGSESRIYLRPGGIWSLEFVCAMEAKEQNQNDQ